MEENLTESYLSGLKNIHREHLLNVFESNIFERYVIPSKLARTLFHVELNVQMTKMKITHQRVIENKCIHLWILADSVNVLSGFKCSHRWCVWKKMFNGEIIFHFKRIGTERTCGLVSFSLIWTHKFLIARISKHSWKKIVQLLRWTVVTY